MWIRQITAITFLAAAAGGCLNVNVPQIPDVNIGNNSSANVGTYVPPSGSVPEGPLPPAPAAGAPVGLYAPDLLAYPDTDVAVTVVVAAQVDPRWAQGATVTFYLGEKPVASGAFNEDGVAAATWRTHRPGEYQLSARVTAVARRDQDPLLRAAPATMLACVRPKDAQLVVIDLDSLTPQAPTVVGRLAGRYTIVYAATRSALSGGAAKDWLRNQGYPPGPLLVAGVKEFAPGGGVFKTARVKDLTRLYSNIRAGVTDKLSDAEEYAQRGSGAILFPRYKADAKGMRKFAKELEKLKARNRVEVVSTWEQVEQILTGRASYPAEAHAAWLRQEAFRMDGKRD
ncbi:MAG: hypothetical protein NTV86_18595 [Planctomycetota bacterium]|nr:hypothetical protein [Planctomycetota bacterium]